MPEHPIEGLMTTAMQSIKDMVDVNTIVGDAVQSPDGTVIIPISRVSFGFAAGGGEYSAYLKTEESDNGEGAQPNKYPFAGGSGAGVSISPVAFMVVGNGQIKLMPVTINSSLDRVLDLVPDLVGRVEELMKKKSGIRKDIHFSSGEGPANKEPKDSKETARGSTAAPGGNHGAKANAPASGTSEEEE